MKIAIIASVALLAVAGVANAQTNTGTDEMSHGQMSHGASGADSMSHGQMSSDHMASHKKSHMSHGAMSDSASSGNTTGH